MTEIKKLEGLPLPLVVQLGFAGSRQLLDTKHHPGVDLATFEAVVEDWLTTRLRQLREDLGLKEWHLFCGISALAVGADTVFVKSCRTIGIPNCIFLPQTRDEFLAATGSAGPDFPIQRQRDEAIALLDSPQVIQERLVSDSSKRCERFEDTNREIVRVSDLLICLIRQEADPKSGGTQDLIVRAIKRGRSVLAVTVGVKDGKPDFNQEWRLPPADVKRGENDGEKKLDLPETPRTLEKARLSNANAGVHTTAREYANCIKDLSSKTAAKMQRRFKLMAGVIVCAHILATVVATIALAFADFHMHILPAMLGLELVMLACGFGVHHHLHRSRTSYRWAEARLLAEVTRSVLAIGSLHVHLEHLFSLPFPAAIRPILKTLNILQLQSAKQDRTPWMQKRDRYVAERLIDPPKGQLPFYTRSASEAGGLLRRLHLAFNALWVTAFISTLTELALHERSLSPDLLSRITGLLAIVMPVLAVAALSLAAALDLETQEHTYDDMVVFIDKQVQRLKDAKSERDYARLVIETEYELLGETANWFSRRSDRTVA